MNNICRLCGQESLTLINIIDKTENDNDNNVPTLLEKIHACLPIRFNRNDGFPSNVCKNCTDKTDMVYEFYDTIKRTQRSLLDKLNVLKDKSCTKLSSTLNTKTNKDVSDVLEKLSRTITISKVSNNNIGMTKDCKTIKKEIKTEENNYNKDDENNQSLLPIGVVTTSSNVNKKEQDDDDADDFDQYFNEDNDDDSDDEDYIVKTKQKTKKLLKSTPKPSSASKVIVVKMKNPAAYVCMTCKQKFPEFEPLKLHMATNQICRQIPLTCDICKKICETKKALYQHNLTHKEKHIFVCDECGKTYSNRFNLDNHKSSIHGEQIDDDLDNDNNVNHNYGCSIYKCKICDNTFTNRRDMYAHINNHTKIPTIHLCDTCGKCFNSSDTLRSHIRIHLNIKPFSCENCDKSFRSRLQLMQHSHVHTGIKLFNCTHCEKSFAKRGSLVAHTRVHTGELPYECTICPVKFNSINKLRTHQKCHNNDHDGGGGAAGIVTTTAPADNDSFVNNISTEIK